MSAIVTAPFRLAAAATTFYYRLVSAIVTAPFRLAAAAATFSYKVASRFIGASYSVASSVVICLCRSRSGLDVKEFPFKDPLKPQGVYRTDPLLSEGQKGEKEFVERKSDLKRMVQPNVEGGLLYVTAESGGPMPWRPATDETDANAIFQDFSQWLAKEVGEVPGGDRGLAQRVMACLSAGELTQFAIRMNFPPQVLQSHVVLVVTKDGEVRVMLVAFITHQAKPGLDSTPFILKLMTRNLNSVHEASDFSRGIVMDYRVVHATEKKISNGGFQPVLQLTAQSYSACK